MVSTNPLVFANEYKWETYEQVDKHRKLIGSGLHALYSSGKFSTREFQTVGVWSVNRPGKDVEKVLRVACINC